MNCEVVAVGTELLLGQIVDTNSSWIGEQLAAAGIDSHHQTKVGDNWERISEVLRTSIDRSDAVIVSGGLGPTHDDITREVMAEIMGVELVMDEEIADRIREMFASRGREMPENNLRQAQVPVGAQVIEQMPGTAPGLIVEVGGGAGSGAAGGGAVVYLVPGVPREMKEMLMGTVISDLTRRSGQDSVIASRVIRTWGESESGLAERLADHIAELDERAASEEGGPTLAFLASGIEGIRVRITAKAKTQPEADAALATEVEKICELLGSLVFSTDDEPIEEVVLKALAAEGSTICLFDAFSGGLIASRLSDAQARLAAAGEIDFEPLKHCVVVPFEAAKMFGGEPGPLSGGLTSSLAEQARFASITPPASFGLAATFDPDERQAEVAIAGAGGVRSSPVRVPGDVGLGRQWATITLLSDLYQLLARRQGKESRK